MGVIIETSDEEERLALIRAIEGASLNDKRVLQEILTILKKEDES